MSTRRVVTEDAWQGLRSFTSARIALGRSGSSLPTAPMLAFQLAHAQARDAVHLPFAAESIATTDASDGEAIRVHSAATTRDIYLRRPDLGRTLDDSSRARLEALPAPVTPYDAVFVIADGLSACAVHEHALNVFTLAQRALTARGWHVAPLVVAEQARVALGDEIGGLLAARQVAILLGERPGLSAADSLGIYLTHAPLKGRSDAERNCISNVRPDGGLSYAQAAHKLVWLMLEAHTRQLTGVALKDESDGHASLVDTADQIRGIE